MPELGEAKQVLDFFRDQDPVFKDAPDVDILRFAAEQDPKVFGPIVQPYLDSLNREQFDKETQMTSRAIQEKERATNNILKFTGQPTEGPQDIIERSVVGNKMPLPEGMDITQARKHYAAQWAKKPVAAMEAEHFVADGYEDFGDQFFRRSMVLWAEHDPVHFLKVADNGGNPIPDAVLGPELAAKRTELGHLMHRQMKAAEGAQRASQQGMHEKAEGFLKTAGQPLATIDPTKRGADALQTARDPLTPGDEGLASSGVDYDSIVESVQKNMGLPRRLAIATGNAARWAARKMGIEDYLFLDQYAYADMDEDARAQVTPMIERQVDAIRRKNPKLAFVAEFVGGMGDPVFFGAFAAATKATAKGAAQAITARAEAAEKVFLNAGIPADKARRYAMGIAETVHEVQLGVGAGGAVGLVAGGISPEEGQGRIEGAVEGAVREGAMGGVGAALGRALIGGVRGAKRALREPRTTGEPIPKGQDYDLSPRSPKEQTKKGVAAEQAARPAVESHKLGQAAEPEMELVPGTNREVTLRDRPTPEGEAPEPFGPEAIDPYSERRVPTIERKKPMEVEGAQRVRQQLDDLDSQIQELADPGISDVRTAPADGAPDPYRGVPSDIKTQSEAVDFLAQKRQGLRDKLVQAELRGRTQEPDIKKRIEGQHAGLARKPKATKTEKALYRITKQAEGAGYARGRRSATAEGKAKLTLLREAWKQKELDTTVVREQLGVDVKQYFGKAKDRGLMTDNEFNRVVNHMTRVKTKPQLDRAFRSLVKIASRIDRRGALRDLKTKLTELSGTHVDPSLDADVRIVLSPLTQADIRGAVPQQAWKDIKKHVGRRTSRMDADDLRRMTSTISEIQALNKRKIRDLDTGRKMTLDELDVAVKENLTRAFPDQTPRSQYADHFLKRNWKELKELISDVHTSKPDVIMRRLDGYSPKGPMQSVQQAILDGEVTGLGHQKAATEALQAHMTKGDFEWGGKRLEQITDWVGKDPDRTSYGYWFDDGAQVQLTRANEMALWAISQNKKARADFVREGLTHDSRPGAVAKIDDDFFVALDRNLPDDAKAIVRAALKFNHETLPKLDKKFFDITGQRLDDVGVYFPTRTKPIKQYEADARDILGGETELHRVPEHMGLTHARVTHNNPFFIDDFFQVYFRHHREVGAILGVAEPLKQYRMLIARNRDLIQRRLGRAHVEYLERYGKVAASTPARNDLDKLERFIRATTNRATLGVLMHNPFVQAKQLGSFTTMKAKLKDMGIKPKPFGALTRGAKGAVMSLVRWPVKAAHNIAGRRRQLDILNRTKVGQEMLEHSPLMWHRYQESAISLSTPRIGEAQSGLGRYKSSAEVGMEGIQLMDFEPIAYGWESIKAHVSRNNPQLEGKAYWDKVVELHNEAVRFSQPDFSPLGQSGIGMRAKDNPFYKLAIMFSSQRNQNVNMGLRAFNDAKYHLSNGNRKAALKSVRLTFNALMAQAMIMTAIDQARSQFFHGDKYGKFGEDALGGTIKNFFGNTYFWGHAVNTAVDGPRGRDNVIEQIWSEAKQAFASSTNSHWERAMDNLIKAGIKLSGKVGTTPYAIGKKLLKD